MRHRQIGAFLFDYNQYINKGVDMAIPKVCGIETEYGYLVLDERGNRVEDDSQILYESTSRFLKEKNAVPYNSIFESAESSIIRVAGILHRHKVERSHRNRAAAILGSVNGFLSNGSRFYIDVTHPEHSTPECLNPLDLVAHNKAGEHIVRAALQSLDGHRVIVHKNNSDGKGHSYGSHLNVLLKRETVAARKDSRYLISMYVPFQIARMVLIGGGKVGSENDAKSCFFQISQRADFFERLTGVHTTVERPIFNTRDEPHADPSRFYRLHDISCDSLMCEYALFFKVALTQVVLSMIEDGFLTECMLPKNPARAMKRISRDLNFKDCIELENGKRYTGFDILRWYLDKAIQYVQIHECTKEQLFALALAYQTLDELKRDRRLTFGKLDWTTTLGLIGGNPRYARGIALQFREVSDMGLYYVLLKKGKIKHLINNEAIRNAVNNPPRDTRAYIRGMLIQKRRENIIDMNWSMTELEFGDHCTNIGMPNPVEVDKALLSTLRL